MRIDAAQNVLELPIDSLETIAWSEDNPYLIKDHIFCGLSSGMHFSEHGAHLEKGLLIEEGREVEVYYIQGIEGEHVGYVKPHTKDEQCIGQITITTPQAHTVDGFRIGSTYAALENEITSIEGHGTEIRGVAYAVRGRELFLLAIENPVHELQEGAPEPTTAVKEIKIKEHRME
ncbi:MAG: hypothetical protein ACRBFS_23310 [Aureispira sp.]